MSEDAGLHWNIAPKVTIRKFCEERDLQPDYLEATPPVLLLPSGDDQGLVFANHSKEVLLALKDGGVPAAYYEDGRELRAEVRESADVVLPLLFVAQPFLMGLALNLMANFIYDHWVKSRRERMSTVRVDIARVDEGQRVTRMSVEGPADAVVRILREYEAEPDGDQNRGGDRSETP